MTTTATHADKAIAAAAEVLGAEPVEAASTAIWTGQWGAMAAMQAVPLVGMILRRQGKRRSGGLPQRFIVALTSERLVVLSQPRAQLKGWEVKAKEVIREWPRAGTTAEAVDNPIGVTLKVAPAGGEPFEVAILDKGAGRAMAAALG